MSTQLEIFEHFKLAKPNNDDDMLTFETKTYSDTVNSIQSLIEDNRWRAYSGRIGSGKSSCIITAIREVHKNLRDFDVVEVTSPNRKKVTSTTVLAEIILQLGEKYLGSDKVNRAENSRYAQVQRILMSAHQKKRKVVLIIDEAQELNTIVLNTIKRLRDVTFIKRSVHLPVIMIGQPALESMIRNNDEVKSRIRHTQFGYTKRELVNITEHRAKGLLSRDECLQIVRLMTDKDGFGNANYPTPLELAASIETAMENAYRAESAQLGIQHFEFANVPKRTIKAKPPKIEIGSTAAQAKIANIERKAEAS